MWENQWLDDGWLKVILRMSYAGFDAFEAYTVKNLGSERYILVEVKGIEWNSAHECQWLQITAVVKDQNDALDLKLRFHGL